MWSLGGVTATLLSGTSLFVDPKDDNFETNPDKAIAKLAAECNLAPLDQSSDWEHVGERAKDFVRKLLIVDEMKRLTVKEALNHPWFTNEYHKDEFEAVYLRATRHWKPRPKKADIIEILHVDTAEESPSAKRQRINPLSRPSSRGAPMPIEPRYSPSDRHIKTLASARWECRSSTAWSYLPPAPPKPPIGWIKSLHEAALLQDKPIRTDLASVRLRWPTAPKSVTLKRKLGSRLTTPQALDSTTRLFPGTEMSSVAWRPARFNTDEEDELAHVEAPSREAKSPNSICTVSK